MSKEFTAAEVAKNISEDSMMIIIDGSVYDVASEFFFSELFLALAFFDQELKRHGIGRKQFRSAKLTTFRYDL